jgi:hypothetical protein
MTVWFHLPTIFNRHYALRVAGIFVLCVALTTTLFFNGTSSAVAGINKTLGYQGRLAYANGSVVPDGHYNIEFKIYQDGTGVAASNPGGTLKWSEAYVNNNSGSGVEVKNGYFSVNLGSITPFGTSVDWNQDTLFVSMNVAGSSASCTTFGTAPCAADGEMLPMKRITSTPYALNAGQLGGKTADSFVQLGQGVQTDASTNSSIFVNKTGAGNLVQLQAGGQDAFVLNNTGSITLGSANNQSISVGTATSGAGKELAVSSGAAATGSNLSGGDLTLQGGAGDGTGTSGNVIVKANQSDSTGTLQVQNAAGENVLNVDTKNTSVSVGSLDLSSSTGSQLAPGTSLWDTTPADGSDYNDIVPVNVGTTFKSDGAGYVTGVKFYSPANANTSGTNVGKLWACNNANCSLASGGTELANVTFPADSTAGWKTANFSTPVYISPNTYYIVTYLSQHGIYHASGHYFDTNYDSAPLHAPGQSVTSNGSYIINSGAFPTGSNNNTNYWVDVVFHPDAKTDQISTENGLNITSGGPMSIGPDNQALSLQGSEINIAATKGGDVTVQGGNATVDNGNGGSVLLSGGAGKGTGASGLVVMTTPTFSTTQNDANCYTGGTTVATDCTITQSTVDNSSAVIVGFSASGKTATLPDPTITTAGRIIYVMAAGGSQDFTLSANTGDAAEQAISMRKNTTTTMIWNGSDWTSASGSSTTTLQDAYNNTSQDAAGNEIVLNNTVGDLTIRDSATNPVNNTLLGVKNSGDSSLFSVNSKVTAGTENASDGTVHDGANFSTNWPAVGGASTARITSDGQEASDSAQVVAGTGAGNGIKNKLSVAPPVNSHYRASVYAKLASGSAFTDFKVQYSPDNGVTFVDCTNYNTQTITTTGWTQITCDIDTGATTVTDPYIYLVQPTAAASARTFLIDTLSFTLASNATSNVKIGSGADSGAPTLFTLDKSAVAPTAADNAALLGSMYYDTTLGKVQCYEADGWGSCGAAPDSFVTISPEYSNAVMNGTDIGTITSDLCSDTLNINDGSSSQPNICGTNETYNFYKWTTTETADQTRSIFVTYKLPDNFKGFVAGSTSLMGRTDSGDSSVSYQIYRDNGSGLTSCGSAMTVSTGAQSSWQKATYSSGDPSGCGFVAGDSMLVRINLTAKNSANSYVSNLGFTFSNN